MGVTYGQAAGISDAIAAIIRLYPAGYLFAGPLREFYLRTNKTGQLEGPYTYYEAEYKGRVATREAARTRVGDISMELVTNVGTRQGDPQITPKVRVVCVYLAGRKITGGALAQYNSDRGNT